MRPIRTVLWEGRRSELVAASNYPMLVRRAVAFVVYQHNRVAFKYGGPGTDVKRAENTEGNSTEV